MRTTIITAAVLAFFSLAPVVHAQRLNGEQATAAFNELQDRYNRPHARSVVYDQQTDSYYWIGPKFGKPMVMSGAQFEGEVSAPYKLAHQVPVGQDSVVLENHKDAINHVERALPIVAPTVAPTPEQVRATVVGGTQEFTYTILSAVLSSRCGDVRPAEGTVYLMVKLTAKNTDSKKHFFGGMFSGNFSAERNGYKYDVDGGAGLAFGSARGVYTGVEEFAPLMSKTMTVVFTVPSEIAIGTCTIKTPTDETFDVAVQ
jgi:hypothetical protein